MKMYKVKMMQNRESLSYGEVEMNMSLNQIN